MGCKPSQDTATLAAPSPASLSVLQPLPTLCRGQPRLCEDLAAEQQQASRCVQYLPSTVVALLSLPILMA